MRVSRLLCVSVSKSMPSTRGSAFLRNSQCHYTWGPGQASVSGATYWLQTHRPSPPERWGPAALPQ